MDRVILATYDKPVPDRMRTELSWPKWMLAKPCRTWTEFSGATWMLVKPHRGEHGQNHLGQDGCSPNRIGSDMSGIVLDNMDACKTIQSRTRTDYFGQYCLYLQNCTWSNMNGVLLAKTEARKTVFGEHGRSDYWPMMDAHRPVQGRTRTESFWTACMLATAYKVERAGNLANVDVRKPYVKACGALL